MPCQVNGISRGLEGISKKCVVNLIRSNTSCFNGSSTTENPQISGGQVFQRSAECAKASALSSKYDNLALVTLRCHGASSENGFAVLVIPGLRVTPPGPHRFIGFGY